MPKSAPILIFGATGQIGRTLHKILGEKSVALARADADLSEPQSVQRALDRIQPSIVINASAYTQVDLAEKEEALAQIINAESPVVMAEWCAKHSVPFVHFSTDYVFSGEGARPWTEEDHPSPVNAYGRTKLLGEIQISKIGGKWLIFRGSWIYDTTGKNFLTTILRLAKEKDTLRIVCDQIGAPTYAQHLAGAVAQGLENAMRLPEFPSGFYHLSHSGETTWHHFAEAIADGARKRGIPLRVKSIEAIPSSDYPTSAKRPCNSRLNSAKVNRVLHVSLPDWKVGLEECLNELKGH